MSPLVIRDARALLDDTAAPLSPNEPASVAACWPTEVPALRLTLRGHKKVASYEAWLWSDQFGQAYFSKRLASGRTMAWKAGATIERAVKHNKSRMTMLPPQERPLSTGENQMTDESKTGGLK